jgi:hypothetical protein
MQKVDQHILEIAEQQHQLVTREQFLVDGSTAQLKRRLRSGALIRVHNSIYRLPGTTPTWRQELLAACLAAGRPSSASFRAALAMTHLPGGEELVEITCPRHRRAQYEGVIAHESRFLEERDLVIIDGIPVTRTPRTLCDIAGLVELGKMSRSTLDHALLDAVRRDLVDVGSVWREYERLGGTIRLGGDTIYDALQRFVPPRRLTESSPELRVLMILREHGFPEPTPQYWITLPDGERIRLDFAWPDCRASLEWDPYKFHGDRDRYEAMQSRTRRLRAMGWERVCITDDDFDAGMPEALAALGQVLGRL